MSEKKGVSIQILPKGLFVHSNGGFKNIEQTEKMYNTVYDFLKKNNLSICVIDDKLEFIPIGIVVKRKKSFFGRFFSNNA